MKPFSSGKLIFVSFSQVADLDLGGVGERRGVSGSKRSKIILMSRTYYSGSVTKCFEMKPTLLSLRIAWKTWLVDIPGKVEIIFLLLHMSFDSKQKLDPSYQK